MARFLANGVLPAFLGSATDEASQSPYRLTPTELLDGFGFSAKRRELIAGLLQLRAELRNLGLTGFQWIDGSFVEQKDPSDIDVVTFYDAPGISNQQLVQIQKQHPELFMPPQCKAAFGCDAYYIRLGAMTKRAVRRVCYWHGLLSHRRATFERKGYLQMDLTGYLDEVAVLNSLGAP